MTTNMATISLYDRLLTALRCPVPTTVADLVAVADRRDVLDEVLVGDGDTDPTIRQWLTDRGADLQAVIDDD
jgi:hypothetical protein